MGPTAAMFGREFEVFINEGYRPSACPIDKIEESINGSTGTLSKSSFEETWAPGTARVTQVHRGSRNLEIEFSETLT